MVQYYVLGFLYYVCKNDCLVVNKMISKVIWYGFKFFFVYCMMIWVVSKQLEEEDGSCDSLLFDFIESCLCNKYEMVVYEVVLVIVNLLGCSVKELVLVVLVFQFFCSLFKVVFCYVVVCIFNKVVMKYLLVVIVCNLDLENLVIDLNCSIVMLVIIIFFKMGSESSIDCFMKQIFFFMLEILDEFKVVVVQVISVLCQKYFCKYVVFMNFLFIMLWEEGGFEYKCVIVDCIISIIEENLESKEIGLLYLCEFIEDCEFIVLVICILYFLGQEGFKIINFLKYICFIYN